MASLSFGKISPIRVEHGPVQAASKVTRRNTPENIAAVADKPVEKQDSSAAARALEQRLSMEADYKYVQRDSDGDTLSVTREGSDMLESDDGRVTAKSGSTVQGEIEAYTAEPDRQAPEAERTAVKAGQESGLPETNTAKEPVQQEITSYAGISGDTLYRYYLDGRISKNDYDSELNRRKELREQEKLENIDNSALMTKVDEKSAEGKAIESSSARKGSDGLNGAERLDAAMKATNPGYAAAAGKNAAASKWEPVADNTKKTDRTDVTRKNALEESNRTLA